MERRRLFAILVGGIATAIGVALAIPAAAMLSFPARRRTVFGGDEPVDVGALAALPEGMPVRVAVAAARRRDAWSAFTNVVLGSAWLVREGQTVRALSTVCPHTGCAVDWDRQQGAFVCPCHDSRFAKDGTRATGPSPRPLDALATEVVDGRVRLAWRRFKTATAKKEPV